MRARIGEPDRVAVGFGARDRFGPHIAAGAGAIVDDDLLLEPFAEFLGDDARDDVGTAAWREWHDQPDRPIRPACLAPGESVRR